MNGSARQKTVILLVPGFPATEADKNWVPAVQNFVRVIAQRNPDIAVHVISFQYPFVHGDYVWNGAIVHALAGRNRRLPFRFRCWIEAAWRGWRLIAQQDVLALHSMWLAECTYVASWLARLSRAKHIASICGQDALAANPYLKHLRFEKMIVAAASANAAHAFSESTGRPVDHIIPTGLDREARSSPPRLAHRSIDILGVGSLIPVKNFSLFIEIIAKLKRKFPALRCMILGDGTERPALERQIQGNYLSEVVQFAGQVPREQVLSTMRTAKILLHTATYEGQGYVFLEALAAGMRVVSFDVGYTGNGHGVDLCRSEEEILGVLETLLAQPFDPEEVQVNCIEETARAFEELYGITQS